MDLSEEDTQMVVELLDYILDEEDRFLGDDGRIFWYDRLTGEKKHCLVSDYIKKAYKKYLQQCNTLGE